MTPLQEIERWIDGHAPEAHWGGRKMGRRSTLRALAALKYAVESLDHFACIAPEEQKFNEVRLPHILAILKDEPEKEE